MCVIDIFCKYPWVAALKDKKGVSIVNAFQKIFDDSMESHSMELYAARKPNKKGVDKASEFYHSSVKKWLIDNDI